MKATKEFKTILLSKEASIAVITLNRPAVLNALSLQMLTELYEAVDDVAKDESIRAVVITGAGRGFCSGGDVNVVGEEGQWSPFYFHDRSKRFHKIIKNITDMEKPVIAAVNGPAAGGGWEIALACDIRIASENAKFGVAYVKMGLLPEQGAIYFLPRLVGLGWAKLFCFTGDLIDARQAEQIGMVEKAVPVSDFDAYVKNLAQKLANMPTRAIGMAKIALNRSYHMDLETSQTYAQNVAYLLFHGEDYKEGPKAFLEKRAPVFKGK